MAGLGPNRRVALGFVALIASGIALAVYLTEALDRSELDTVDARFAIRGDEPPPDELAVVAIDDTSFGDLKEQWPFPRSLHGEMIDVLSAAGARAILYDVQFTEATTAREDNRLVSAVASTDVPIALATEEVNRNGDTNVFGGERVLRQVGARAGNSAFDPDPGGVWRRLPFASDGLESLAVVMVEERDGTQVDPSQFPDDGAWIDFYGPPETIATYSFSKVLDGSVDGAAFEDKTVVVGASAPTLQDVHPVSTSDNELMAGAEVQANAIATVAREIPLGEAPRGLGALLIVLMGTVVPAAGLRLPPLPAAGIGLLAGAAYLLVAQLAFNGGLIAPILDPLLALVLAIVGTLFVHYTLAAFERQRVRDTFARFVPPEVVGAVLARTDKDLHLRSSRREATVLFADLRSFTSFAESWPSDRVVEVLNRYLGEMTDAIMDHGGTLVSFMGDGIMAVFGAPLDQSDHADRALAAAREMAGPRLSAFNEWIARTEGGDGFEIGIGLNSGEVMAGQVGSRRRVEYTAIGDTTNIAARLEAMTKETPHHMFISGASRALLTDASGLVFVERLEVRGRSRPIDVWTDAEGRR
ncbi:MAG: adenylate/guanylate cyclase domain-containing protein [Solirubrobacterales bacterium]